MFTYLRLIRVHYLVLIACAQYFIRNFLLLPLLNSAGVTPELTDSSFLILVLGSVFLSAGGYVINDYFDQRVDHINRPSQMLVGRLVPRRIAMALHLAFTFLGVVLIGFVAYQLHLTVLVLLAMLIAGMLWFYSTTYKHQALVGNLIIALLAVSVVVIVPLFEPQLIRQFFEGGNEQLASVVVFILGFYTLLVFLLAFAHSLVKDLEDLEGDASVSSSTIPLSWGISTGKWIALVVLCIIMALVGLVQKIQLDSHTNIHFFYSLISIQLPLLLAVFFCYQANDSTQYKIVGRLINWVMYAGVISIVVFRFLDNG